MSNRIPGFRLGCADPAVEQNLRKRIAELQEYRRMGITTAAEAEVYDQAKIARVGHSTEVIKESVC